MADSDNGGNTFLDNTVNDAYCGVAYVSGSVLLTGTYLNTLFPTLMADLYADGYPPATLAK